MMTAVSDDDDAWKDDLLASIKTVDCRDKPDQHLGDSTMHQTGALTLIWLTFPLADDDVLRLNILLICWHQQKLHSMESIRNGVEFQKMPF